MNANIDDTQGYQDSSLNISLNSAIEGGRKSPT